MVESEEVRTEDLRHPFAADRPIETPSEDLLGRSTFAAEVAKSIEGWKQRESLAIALCGSWGSGKSSVKNMVLHSLRTSACMAPQIVEFNAWQWSGSGQIDAAFLKVIGESLGRTDSTQAGRACASKWDVYARKLSLLDTLTRPVSAFALRLATGTHLLVTATFVCAVLCPGLSLSWRALLLAAFLAIVVGLCAFPKWLAEVCEKASNYLSVEAKAHEISLPELKCQLADLLRKRELPLVIVMDDIDRLQSEEIPQIFRLIKANADFPNMVYFLLFQRDVVTEALNDVSCNDGKGYLEKLVQVTFDLPEIDRPKLEEVLFCGLNAILEKHDLGASFEEYWWNQLYYEGIRGLFRTVRDVRRFVSSFSFHVNLFHGKMAYEVNPVDLIAIEALHLFEPNCYRRIHAAKVALTQKRQSVPFADDEFNKRDRETIDSVIEACSERNREAIRRIIRRLFPLSERVYSGHSPGAPSDDECLRRLRVCHPLVFDRYFHYAIPIGDVSQSDVQRVLEVARDRERLAHVFRSLDDQRLLAPMIERLESYADTIPKESTLSFITALMDIGELLSTDKHGIVGANAPLRAQLLIRALLQRESYPAKRLEIFLKTVNDTYGLAAPIMAIADECNEKSRRGDPDDFLVKDEHLGELKSAGATKIREAAAQGSLLNHADLHQILYHWSHWADVTEVQAWFVSSIETREGLLRALAAFTFKSSAHISMESAPEESYNLRVEAIERYATLEQIEQRVRFVTDVDLNPEQVRGLQAFQCAIERRRSGISAELWPTFDAE